MQMRIVVPRSPGGLQNDNGSYVERNTGRSMHDVFQASILSLPECAQQCWIAIEVRMQKVGDNQDDVPVSDAGKQASCNEVRPLLGVYAIAGKTKARLAGEGDSPGLPAVPATVLDKPHSFGITAIQHLPDSLVVLRRVKTGINILKFVPVILENLLERTVINAVPGHGSPCLHGV